MIADDFAKLFRGNDEAYGGDEGRCIRKPVTLDVFARHLSGVEPIGIYPLVHGRKILTAAMLPPPAPQSFVYWGCTDLDMPKMGLHPDDATMAKNLHKVLNVLGITSWVEISKSKGFHVWVFVSHWVPAEAMRDALLFAHQVAGIPAHEVNPKQVDGVELGNYVRLPYPGRAERGRQVVLATGTTPQSHLRFPLPLEAFLQAALETRNDPFHIHEVAKRYVRPVRAKAFVPTHVSGTVDVDTDKMSGLSWTIFNEGPLENGDRSTALAKLAHCLKEDGYCLSEIYDLLVDADSRWGKFYARKDGAEQLRRLTENA